MRTEGRPSRVEVASAAASGSNSSAARASASQPARGTSGSRSSSSIHASITRIYCRRARIRWKRWLPRARSRSAPRYPGPAPGRSRNARNASIARPLLVHLPIFAERAENATITDVDGNVFVDFAGGVGVVNAGHAHPRIVEAVVEQAARFLHTDFTVVPYEPAVSLAERLCALAPISGETRAAFFNAGTEAVENAVKLARLHTGRPGVIAFEGAFHGRTLLSMTMTSKFHPYKTGMGPYAPEVYRAPYPDAYRGPDAAEALARLERLFETHVAPEHVAAIVIEPQLGEGGFVPAPRAYMEGLRAICDRHGIVLVADEVQTGFGRTGRMFAMEHFGVEPDLMTVAKSIAAGLPLSGVIGRAEIMDGAHAGAIGGTYIGNPVAQAAALAVLDVFEEEDLVARGVRRRLRGSASGCSTGSSAGPRSATSAVSARCSRSSS